VLIFDEATSNLDRRTAETFATTINRLRGKVAILFITHARFASLKFDRVIELASPSNNEAGPQGTASSSFAPGVYAMRSATGRFASAPGGRPPSANQQAAAGQDK
jgi:ABC-type transport system involved in cytochrome bd biosynthesis fused ATPase/permease subunit